MGFPETRLRRLRRTDAIRSLVRETTLRPEHLILPLFVHDAADNAPIATMPGVFRHSLASLIETARSAYSHGIPAVAVFPVIEPQLKSDDAKLAVDPNNLVCRAVRALKKNLPDLLVICDVALDPFTTHGHDGLIENNYVVNDKTVAMLVEQSLVQAEAGCDILAPSDMMDGRIGAIRRALEQRGFNDTMLLSYAAKYASAFYGPFRDAVGSKANLKGASKATYQMDPANRKEALREVALDLEEGADIVMVKPGMPYLDVVREVVDRFAVPTYVYQVSGEYAALKFGAQQGLFDGERAMLEALVCMRRAGATGILTYAALDVARQLQSASV